jgi:hypothetical protein
MSDTWFTGVADELARCLLEAEACAEACEALLAAVNESADAELKRLVVDILIAPAAIARALIELIDQPPRLVLATCRLCRDSAQQAAEKLEALGGGLEIAQTIEALRASVSSCERLLDVAS